jgi:hypothetical protein
LAGLQGTNLKDRLIGVARIHQPPQAAQGLGIA